jgi:endoglucanase
MNRIAVFLLLTILFLTASAKEKVFFASGDRICFFGNSITQAAEFHHNVMLYHITRFPGQPLSFFNCGIGGSTANSALERLESDVLVNKPTHVIIMFGMNDVNRSLYKSKSTTNSDTLRIREDAIKKHKLNYEKIVNIFLSKNIKVILQKPTIYDQTAKTKVLNNYGVNDALKICADYIGDLGKKYQLPVVDYWTIMNQINEQVQKNDSLATIVGADRVHPGSVGHLIMSYQFLKSENAPTYVSKICISKNKKTSSKRSLNCEIQSVNTTRDSITFTVKENALPFPTSDSQLKGLELVPFMKELNWELLQMDNLKNGRYQLFIDAKQIGEFTNQQLKEGVNLAEFKNTPQYLQAQSVMYSLNKLYEKESAIRGIKYIEYNPYFKTCPDKNNFETIKIHFDSMMKVNKNNNTFLLKVLDNYSTNKPLEKKMEETSDNLRKEVYRIAQPVKHIFMLCATLKDRLNYRRKN